MWIGAGVCISCFDPHDLSEAAGEAALAVSGRTQFSHPAGLGQPGRSVLHVKNAVGSLCKAEKMRRKVLHPALGY